MRRLVNLRAMLLVALCLTVIILALYLTEISFAAGIFVNCIVFASLIVALIASIRRANKKLFWALAISVIACVLCCLSFELRLNFYHSVSPEPTEVYEVSGIVDSIADEDGIVKNVVISDASINGKSIRGNVVIVLSDDGLNRDEIFTGFGFKTSGKLYKVELIGENGVDGTSYRNNLRYRLYTSSDDCALTPKSLGFFARIRKSMYDRLVAACGSDYGSTVYCMLTGDKTELDDTTYKMYSINGIGHVLAVSGLHVGLLSTVLMVVLRKLKVSRVARFIIVSVFLIAYAIFVGLNSSVVRATIMCIIAMVAVTFGAQNDLLNSMSFAYVCILVVSPFFLFELGFLMSFGSVYGLALFSRTFNRALRRIRIPKFIAAPLSATLSVHLGTVPVIAYFFGAMQTYSIIANLLLLPIIAAVFTLFAVLLPVSMLFGVNLLLNACALGFAFVDTATSVIASLPAAVVYIKSHSALFLTYPMYFAASRFFMLAKGKVFVSSSVLLICAALILVPTLATWNIPSELAHSLIPVNSYGDVTTIIVDDGVTVIGDVRNPAVLKATLKNYNIRKVDTVILNKLDGKIGSALGEFLSDYKVEKVVCVVETAENDGIAALGGYKNFYIYEQANLQNVTPVFSGNKFVGYLYVSFVGVSVLSVGYSGRYTLASPEILDAAPIIRCFMYLNQADERIYLSNMPKGYLGETPREQFSLADIGSFVYKTETGEILKRA